MVGTTPRGSSTLQFEIIIKKTCHSKSLLDELARASVRLSGRLRSIRVPLTPDSTCLNYILSHYYGGSWGSSLQDPILAGHCVPDPDSNFEPHASHSRFFRSMVCRTKPQLTKKTRTMSNRGHWYWYQRNIKNRHHDRWRCSISRAAQWYRVQTQHVDRTASRYRYPPYPTRSPIASSAWFRVHPQTGRTSTPRTRTPDGTLPAAPQTRHRPPGRVPVRVCVWGCHTR